MKYLSPEPPLETRWECRMESVKAIGFQVTNFQADLVETK
jgi:hypothetical protein